MNKQQIINNLQQRFIDMSLDPQTMDLLAEWDSELDDAENHRILYEKVDGLIGKTLKDTFKDQINQEEKFKQQQQDQINKHNDIEAVKEDKLKKIFGDNRIIGLAGAKSTGKTNNLIAMIVEFRLINKETPIYIYGVDSKTINYLLKLGNIYEVSSLSQLGDKEDCLIVIEEFQRLQLNDRRYKYQLDQFVDFIYHRNCWCIFSSPSLREYNSIIGGKIERWCLKSLRLADLVNGCQLKVAVMSYRGRFKILNDIKTPQDTLLILNDEYEQMVKLDYIPEVDSKKDRVNIFQIKSQKNVAENVIGIIK